MAEHPDQNSFFWGVGFFLFFFFKGGIVFSLFFFSSGQGERKLFIHCPASLKMCLMGSRKEIGMTERKEESQYLRKIIKAGWERGARKSEGILRDYLKQCLNFSVGGEEPMSTNAIDRGSSLIPVYDRSGIGFFWGLISLAVNN